VDVPLCFYPEVKVIHQVDNILWFKLNGLIRYVMVHGASNLLPLYIVNEYPKSGGSWVAQMLSDVLEIPFPRNRLPMLRSCIFHEHMMQSWNVRNMVLVWRDGRDILVSQYYHSLFPNDKGNARLVRQCRDDLRFKDYDDINANLPRFIEYVFSEKRHPKMSWNEFVEKWWGHEQWVHVTYEALRAQPQIELERIVQELTGIQPIPERVAEIVARRSFERQSGRRAGEEKKQSFMRKGIVGDWKNHFDLESKQRFCHYAGDALIALGYEVDNSWTE
jgi:hypothetical protein